MKKKICCKLLQTTNCKQNFKKFVLQHDTHSLRHEQKRTATTKKHLQHLKDNYCDIAKMPAKTNKKGNRRRPWAGSGLPNAATASRAPGSAVGGSTTPDAQRTWSPPPDPPGRLSDLEPQICRRCSRRASGGPRHHCTALSGGVDVLVDSTAIPAPLGSRGTRGREGEKKRLGEALAAVAPPVGSDGGALRLHCYSAPSGVLRRQPGDGGPPESGDVAGRGMEMREREREWSSRQRRRGRGGVVGGAAGGRGRGGVLGG